MGGNNNMLFKEALTDKKIPILTLDNKWHRIFTQQLKHPVINKKVSAINDLLAQQGKLNNEIKDIKKLKTKLMDEIVSGIDGVPLTDKEMGEHKRLINDCNDKVDEIQDQLLDLPREIDAINYELMLLTMEFCYDTMESNTAEIQQIAEWITKVRVELKKNVIRKQEKEMINQEMYSYMHDIFGPEVIEIFDLKYNPDQNRLKKASESPSKMDTSKESQKTEATQTSQEASQETGKA